MTPDKLTKITCLRIFNYVQVMLWSQIKLTHLITETDTFDNRPGTGRFFNVFSCVITYRTGAGPCLCMITSAGHRTMSYAALLAL